jgi:Flp pilus assembly protein TadG
MIHKKRARERGNRRAGSKSGVAALEFGLLAPVMALLVVGVFDLAKISILSEQVWNASRSIAESASTLALPVTPGGQNLMTWQNAELALSATYGEIPWLAAGIATGNNQANGHLSGSNYVAVLTSVNYTAPGQPCASGTDSCCPPNSTTYCAQVVWSRAYVHAGFNSTSSVVRTCGSLLTQVAPGSPNNPQNISTQNVGSGLTSAAITVPDPFFVADVRLIYTPFFFNFVTGPLTLSATSYVPVRTSNPGSTSQYALLQDDGDPAAGSGAVCNTAALRS